MSNREKKYYLWTIGCQMNEADSRHLSSQLETIGYDRTPQPEDADLVVLNTCVVRQQAEDRIYGRLGSLKTIKEKNPNLTIGVMGCLVGVKEAPRLKQQFPFVDVFMSPSDTRPLMDYLQRQGELEYFPAIDAQERSLRDRIQDAVNVLPVEQRGQVVTAFVPVVLGCSHACTFCIIPYRRGVERSRPLEAIITEIQTLVSQGVREVTLLGQIVDRYGLDLPEHLTLAALLKKIHKIDGLDRIRFLTSHPNWMTDELLDAVAELPKVCPHLEVPVQAGNDEVLTKMRRGYTIGQFYSLVDRIRGRIPEAAIHTDIIVGFPGETEQQFMDTYQLLSEICFDKVHTSKYSTRPKTVAARKMIDDVPDGEKARRHQLLDQLQHKIQLKKNSSLFGEAVDVLVDGKHKDLWRGRTPHNKIVFFDDERECLGSTISIKITRTGPYSLSGNVAEYAKSAF